LEPTEYYILLAGRLTDFLILQAVQMSFSFDCLIFGWLRGAL